MDDKNNCISVLALLTMSWQIMKMPRKVSVIHIWQRGTSSRPIELPGTAKVSGLFGLEKWTS